MEGLDTQNKEQEKKENDIWDQLLNDPNFKDAAKEVEKALTQIEEQRREEEGHAENKLVEKERVAELEAHAEKERMEKEAGEKEPAKAA